ncbi:V-set and immunoglobulin domain-containing protein 8 [Maylandia zebra]|uniref:V-set and immunoglobulin domain-containing protein 8 n=1 Tax=Maylandia zebra TaxID=106582 RepID=UPI00403CCD80
MSAVTASLCSTLMFVLFVSADQKIKTAESGQDVRLTCRVQNNNIVVLLWSRTNLREEYVLVYRDGHFESHNQHPSFNNRVDLQDRQMKDGDVSLILKNVTFNDAGTYECRAIQGIGQPMKLISSIHLHVVPPVPENIITAESGQNVTLRCKAPNNNIITAVEWRRADLWLEYVLLYRDGHFESHNQHPSFKDRVDLQDRQMKDGDVSLILKNVNTADDGTYECRVFMEGTNRRKRASLKTDPISSMYLSVDTPDQPGNHGMDGSVGLIVGLIVLSLILAAEVAYITYKRKRRNSNTDFNSGSTVQHLIDMN